MKQIRQLIPVLGILALIALFLKLPGTPDIFGLFKCKVCSSSDFPYFALIGAGYFALLVAISLLFPAFPAVQVARGGVVWAVLLGVSLTYLDLPNWCIACLIGHLCNILIWTIWMTVPPAGNESSAATVKERLCQVLFMSISVVALFSSLNLTFMAYGFHLDRTISVTGLVLGEPAPVFTVQTIEGHPVFNAGVVINFITPDCPYCKEQQLIFNAVAAESAGRSYRFINVSPVVPSEWLQHSPGIEWIEDKEGQLRKLFKVAGYPTLFVIGADGKLAQIIPGVPEQLKAQLQKSLLNFQ